MPDRLRVLGADVKDAVLRADGVGGDGQPFDHPLRVGFEDETVHERPRVALVAVADHVLRRRLVALGAAAPGPLPAANASFVAWVSIGAVAQLAATAFLIGAMEQRSFVIAVAFSKTEIMQVALYSIVLLGSYNFV